MFFLRENIENFIKCIFLLIFVFPQPSRLCADNYSLVLSFGLIKQSIYNVKTEYIENDNIYEIKFELLSTNGVSNILTDKIEGFGFSNGDIINGEHIPRKYQYIENKKDSKKEYYIEFNDENSANGSRIPTYDKSKLTPIDEDMLINVIDPALAFFKLSNLSMLNECNKTIQIYDAKRRFDLNISNFKKNENTVKCSIKSKKIGGYKIKEKLNPLELPYEMIIEFENINDTYKLNSIIGKNQYFTVSIERI